MAIKANPETIDRAKWAARARRIDRGAAAYSGGGNNKVESQNFSAIDDKPETGSEHYVSPIMNGDRVNEGWVNAAIEKHKGNDEVVGHLQTVKDEIESRNRSGVGYSR